eukprot:g2098.t1
MPLGFPPLPPGFPPHAHSQELAARVGTGLLSAQPGDFESAFPGGAQDAAWRALRPLLELSAAARGPLPLSLAAAALGLSLAEAQRQLEAVSRLFPTTDGLLQPIEAGVAADTTEPEPDASAPPASSSSPHPAAWLLDGESRGFAFDVAAGHAMLMAACLSLDVASSVDGAPLIGRREQAGSEESSSYEDAVRARQGAPAHAYALAHGVRHMLRSGIAAAGVGAAGGWECIGAALCDLRYLEAKAAAGQALEAVREMEEYVCALALAGETARVAESDIGMVRGGEMKNRWVPLGQQRGRISKPGDKQPQRRRKRASVVARDAWLRAKARADEYLRFVRTAWHHLVRRPWLTVVLAAQMPDAMSPAVQAAQLLCFAAGWLEIRERAGAARRWKRRFFVTLDEAEASAPSGHALPRRSSLSKMVPLLRRGSSIKLEGLPAAGAGACGADGGEGATADGSGLRIAYYASAVYHKHKRLGVFMLDSNGANDVDVTQVFASARSFASMGSFVGAAEDAQLRRSSSRFAAFPDAFEVTLMNGMRRRLNAPSKVEKDKWMAALSPRAPGTSRGGARRPGAWLEWRNKPLALSAVLLHSMTHAAGAVQLRSIAFSSAGTRLAAAGSDGRMTVWDTDTGKLLFAAVHGEGEVSCMCASPDGTRYATGGTDGRVVGWDATTGARLLQQHHSESAGVWCVCWAARNIMNKHGGWVASGGCDGSVMVWDSRLGVVVTRMEQCTGPVRGVCFSPDGMWLASGGEDGRVVVWEAREGLWVSVMQHGGVEVYSVTYSPCGRWLASGDFDGRVVLWGAKSGRRVAEMPLRHGRGAVSGLCFSLDGSRLASAGFDGRIVVWDVRTGMQTAEMEPGGGALYTVAFSADGSRLAAGGLDGRLTMYDAGSTSLAQVAVRAGHSGDYDYDGGGSTIDEYFDDNIGGDGVAGGGGGEVCTACFAPGGEWLATGGRENGSVALWDTATGERAFVAQHGDDGCTWVRCIGFSPDAKTLVSGGDDAHVRVWAVPSGQALRALNHGETVVRTGFSPDGTQVASASEHGVRIWDVETWQCEEGEQGRGLDRPFPWDGVGSTGRSFVAPAGYFVSVDDNGAVTVRAPEGARGALPPPGAGKDVCFFTPTEKESALAVCVNGHGNIVVARATEEPPLVLVPHQLDLLRLKA